MKYILETHAITQLLEFYIENLVVKNNPFDLNNIRTITMRITLASYTIPSRSSEHLYILSNMLDEAYTQT